jgi:hypothetical protein
MRNKKVGLVLVAPLLLFVLGCQCWPVGLIAGEVAEEMITSKEIAEDISEEILSEIEKTFPLPDSEIIIINHVGGTLNLKTRLPVEEVIDFYRDAYDEMGLTERASETNITETNANLVFDGHESGQTVIVQVAGRDSELTKVTIRMEND